MDLEIDLSVKKQFLDVAVIRKNQGLFVGQLPDGFDPLNDYNLISFKSFQQALDGWAIKELVGYYVNYRKKESPSLDNLLPESQFRLLAVSARFPQQLASQIELRRSQDGVYDCTWGLDGIRIIVLRELPLTQQNAVLQLFSHDPLQIMFARDQYQQKSPDSSGLIQKLLAYYQKEGLSVPYTIEDYRRERRQEVIDELTQQDLPEIIAKIAQKSGHVALDSLSPEERLRGLSLKEVLQIITPQQLIGEMPLEEFLAEVPVEKIKKYLDELTNKSSEAKKN